MLQVCLFNWIRPVLAGFYNQGCSLSAGLAQSVGKVSYISARLATSARSSRILAPDCRMNLRCLETSLRSRFTVESRFSAATSLLRSSYKISSRPISSESTSRMLSEKKSFETTGCLKCPNKIFPIPALKTQTSHEFMTPISAGLAWQHCHLRGMVGE